MQDNRKKNKFKFLDNASSMMILVVFFVLCLIIAAVIGIYSVKKNRQENADGESSEQGFTKETVYENNGTSAGEKETAANTQTTMDTAEKDIIFEGRGEDGVLVTMIHTGGWGNEDDPFLQYEIVITNTGDEDLSDWCIKIRTASDAVCNNIWNGSAELENGMLVITPADFNKTIVSGMQAMVGIIIEKPGELAFEDVTFSKVHE